MQLKPELFGATGKAPVPAGNQVPTSQSNSTAKLSDMLEAIADWSLEQKQQLGAALGLSSSVAAPGLTSTGHRPPVPVQQGAPLMGDAYTYQGWGIIHSLLCHLSQYFQHLVQSSHSSLEGQTL